MFKLFTTLLVLCSTSALVSAGPCDELPVFCTPTQVINCVRSVKFEDSYYKEAIDDIAKAVEPYIFLDILKNPPQPEGFTDYFKPLDLVAELKKVPTENTNFYDFFRKTQEALMATQDGHFSFQFLGNANFSNRLLDFYLSPPIVLYADTNDQGEPIMLGEPVPKVMDMYDPYTQSTAILKVKQFIEAHKGVPIVSINDKNPFEYVLNIGSKYYNYLKNINAKYTYTTNSLAIGQTPLYYMPMDIEDFSNFTVVYEDGQSFSLDYFFVSSEAFEGRRRRRSVDGKTFTEVAREMVKNSPPGKLVTYEEIMKVYNSEEEIKKRPSEREVLEKLKKVNLKQMRAKRETSEPTGIWDFVSKDEIFKCKVDDINQVNVYYTSSFYPSDVDDYFDVQIRCIAAFENNTYPIIAITNDNTGGMAVLTNILQEAVQPDMVSRSYFSYGTDNATKTAFATLLKDPSYADTETCKPFETVEDLMAGAMTEDYGNGVTHTHTKPVFAAYQASREVIDEVKQNITNRRKPTEVVVFTDSYSFSAGSIFTKGLKEAGGAIMVGYNGYPGSTAETFDIGQSPTQVMSEESLKLFSPDECARLKEKGIIYGSMSFGESFRVEDIDNNKSLLVPREFLVDPADERVPYYGAYSDDAYDTFVEMGKTVLEKYKTECNPNNPKLHMRDASCDAVINKEHMHGGFTCGADGKWTTTCEGYYCDDGYYFDYHAKECVRDPCYAMTSSSSSSSSSEDKESHESGSQGSFSSNLVVNTFLLLFVALMML